MTAKRKPDPPAKIRMQDLVIVCAVGLFVALLFLRMLAFVFGHAHHH